MAGLPADLQQAMAHHQAGRLAEAEAGYRRILKARSKDPDALHLLGVLAHQRGRHPEAVRLMERALAARPLYPAALDNLGVALRALGRLPEAAERHRQAAALAPANADAWFNLALVTFEQGAAAEALGPIQRALALKPGNPQAWSLLAYAFAATGGAGVDPGLAPLILQLLDQAHVAPGPLSRPVLTLLRRDAAFAALLADPSPDLAQAAATLSRLPLLLRILELAPAVDLELEALLTRLRRGLILQARSRDLGPETWPFLAALAALAAQCFINEYVFSETEEERAAATALAEELEAHLEAGAAPPAWVAAVAAFQPLASQPWAEGLLALRWTPEFQRLLAQQVAEPREEAILRRELPSLTPIQDAVSLQVQAQYEANPYPRWVRTERHPAARPIHEVLRSLQPPLDPGAWTAPDGAEILVAGCGTGEHPIGTASRFRHRRLLALDLSRASLAYAARKARELGLESLEFAQADILALGGLDRRFDLIDCAGVLHHLADPMAGWRVLAGLLKPGGVMAVALYSEAARQPEVRARARIAELGVRPTPEGIRGFRQALIQEAEDADLAWLRTTRDFFSASTCRDLLFHVQEHRFTLPQIRACIEALGLRFLGLETPPDVAARFRAFAPDVAWTDLDAWDRFEQAHPGTFRAMYQFWCQKP